MPTGSGGRPARRTQLDVVVNAMSSVTEISTRSIVAPNSTRPNGRSSSARRIGPAVLTVATYVIVLSSLLPLLWLILTSLKTRVDAFAMPPALFFTPTLENFAAALRTGGFFASYANSLIIALGTTAVSLVLGIAAGYGLSRPIRGGKIMGAWIVLARMAPAVAFAIPVFVMFGWLGLLDSYIGLIMIYLTVTLPFVAWLMRGFFLDLPAEMEEAARLDGCSRIQALFAVLLPSVKSGVSTCAIFAFIMAWNEFFYALIIAGRETRPASVAIQGFISSAGTDWGALCAAALLVVAPVLIFTIFTQKGLVRGLTAGSVK